MKEQATDIMNGTETWIFEAQILREQRDKLLAAVRYAGGSLSQSATYEIPPIVIRDVAEMLTRVNQELNLP